MITTDGLHEKGATQGKCEEVLRIAQETMEKGFDHEIILTLTRLSPDDLIAPSHQPCNTGS